MTASMTPLGEVADFINGVAFKADEWTDVGTPIIRIQNLNDATKPFNKTTRFVPERNTARHGDLLVSWAASLGVYEWRGEKSYINQHIFKVIPDESKIDRAYLRRALETSIATMESQMHGATMKHITREKFLSVPIPLPSLSEQQRIAAILDKADALRAKRREAIAKLDQLLHSVFIEMFGDPATNPKGWPLVCLGDAIEFSTGKLDSNAAEENGAYPFFTCSRTPSRINTYAFDCEALLLAGNNAAGQYWVKHYSGKFNAYQRTYVLRLKNEHCTYLYMKQALQARLLDLQRMSKGSNTKYLTLSILKPMLIPLAPIEIQRSYCAFYVKLQQLLTDQYRSLEHLDALFRAAQDQVFSGTL